MPLSALYILIYITEASATRINTHTHSHTHTPTFMHANKIKREVGGMRRSSAWFTKLTRTLQNRNSVSSYRIAHASYNAICAYVHLVGYPVHELKELSNSHDLCHLLH